MPGGCSCQWLQGMMSSSLTCCESTNCRSTQSLCPMQLPGGWQCSHDHGGMLIKSAMLSCWCAAMLHEGKGLCNAALSREDACLAQC